jgi:hypothetical protein
VDVFGEGVVGEFLLDLNGLAGLDEFVDVRRHGNGKLSSQSCRYAVQ